MAQIKTFVSGMLAGACIGLGGIANLVTDNKILGAFLFTIGLYTVLIFGLKLYTGQIPYIVQTRDPVILFVLIGNLAGAWIMGWLLRLSGLEYRDAVSAKLSRSPLNWLVLSFLCGICIYVGVEAFKTGHEIITGLAVMVFVLCGFEHSIADAFYFTVSGWSGRAVACLIIIIIGNALGGIVFHNAVRVSSSKNKG